MKEITDIEEALNILQGIENGALTSKFIKLVIENE